MLAGGTALLGAPAAGADEVRSAQWYLASLGVSKAWSITQGNGVKIGIVDTGVDGSAIDLRGAVVAGKDFSGAGATNGQKPVGQRGPHGTGVAALAAGRGHGSSGVIGTAPQASIVTASIRLDGTSPGSEAPAAVRWLVDQGVGVINMSLITLAEPAQLRAAIGYAQAKDVVVVAASGDVALGSTRLQPPASLPGVVAVTGVDKNLRLDPGATTGQGTAVAAPFSTQATTPFSSRTSIGLPVLEPSGSATRYSQDVGTSLSAPIVAGIVALIRAKYPDENAATVISRLLKSATPAGGSVPNNSYGYGIVDADKALTLDVASVDTNPLGSVAPASGQSTGAPSSGGQSSAPLSQPASAPGRTASPVALTDSSSGLGTGAIIAVIAAVAVLALLVIWLFARRPVRPPGAPLPPPRR